MMYVPFHEYFPEIAKKETRCIIAFNDPKLPSGEYGLVEHFCNDSRCDCRRVFFNVMSLISKKPLAVIAYGWESKKFYVKWMGMNDPRIIKDLKGPCLNSASPQSKLAPILLEYVKDVLKDDMYVSRIKRHYKMFKEKIKQKSLKKHSRR